MSLEAELKKAGIDAADVKRLGRLIKKVDKEPALADAVRYIAGLGKKPRADLRTHEKELVAALHDPRQLTDWDRRVFDLWGHKDMQLMLELRDWISAQIKKYPGEPIADQVVAAAANLDIDGNEYLFHALALDRYAGKQLTSSGRWLIARAREDFTKLKKAFPYGLDSEFTAFLALEAPDLYQKHKRKLVELSPWELEAIEKKRAAQTKTTKPKARPVKQGAYAFDRYAAALVMGFSKELDDELTDIRSLWVYIPQSRTLPELVVVNTRDGEEHPYSVVEPTGALRKVADAEDDPVLESISDGLDEPLAWGDYYELPTTILNYELVRAAQQIGKTLGKRVNGAKVGLMIEDEDFTKPETFAKLAKDRIKKLPAANREALIAACYADAKAAAWLK